MPKAPQTNSKSSSPIKEPVNRTGLIAAVAVCFLAIGVFAYQAKVTMENRPPERLRLGEEVKLEPPPGLPDSDGSALRNELNAIVPARTMAMANRKPGNYVKVAQVALLANDFLTAREALLAAVAGQKDVPMIVNDMLGRTHLELGNPDKALAIYNKLIKEYPTRIEPYVGKSRSLAALGRTSELAAPLELGMKSIKSNDYGGFIYLATEYDRLRDLAKALTAAERAMRADPDNATVKILNAGILYKLRRYDEALVLLRAVVTSDAKNGPARRMLAQILDSDLTGKRDRVEAEHYFLEALNISDKDSDAAWRLATSCIEQKRFKQAAYLLTLLLKSVPDSAGARQQLSKVESNLGNTTESLEQAKIATLLLERNSDEALKKAERDRKQTDPLAHLALGQHYVKYSQFKPALLELEAAYNLSPSIGDKPLHELYSTIGVPQPVYDMKTP